MPSLYRRAEDKAQRAFNAYICERDAHLPCIDCSCLNALQWHAGHYKTRGAHPELAFEETNCHKQCATCNTDGFRGQAKYRKNLVKKIGIGAVEWLERDHPPKHFTIDDFDDLKKTYKQKLQQLREEPLLPLPEPF